jgi:hypothetical protein
MRGVAVLTACKGKEGAMPGDPKECRANAERCSELAAETTNKRLNESLLSLAAMWTQLAMELDHTRNLMEARGAPMCDGTANRADVPWYSQPRP